MLLQLQNTILEMIATGRPLEETLDCLKLRRSGGASSRIGRMAAYGKWSPTPKRPKCGRIAVSRAPIAKRQLRGGVLPDSFYPHKQDTGRFSAQQHNT